MKLDFDYQSKVWGTVVPTDSPFSLTGLRFYHFLPHVRHKKGKLLEIGCGAGGNLQGLRAYAHELEMHGVDISVNAISEGHRLFPHLHLSVAEAEHLPFPDNWFDIVCFFDVLEHVVDPEACIKEAMRVLTPGGVLHAYIPCEGELLSLHGMFNACGLNLKQATAGHIQKLTRKQLFLMCERCQAHITESAWSCHLINQVGDLSYYLYLTLSGKRLERSLEGSIGHSASPVTAFATGIIVRVIACVWYWESRLLWFFPGAGVHITAIKK